MASILHWCIFVLKRLKKNIIIKISIIITALLVVNDKNFSVKTIIPSHQRVFKVFPPQKRYFVASKEIGSLRFDHLWLSKIQVKLIFSCCRKTKKLNNSQTFCFIVHTLVWIVQCAMCFWNIQLKKKKLDKHKNIVLSWDQHGFAKELSKMKPELYCYWYKIIINCNNLTSGVSMNFFFGIVVFFI